MAQLRREYTLRPEFQELWEKIKHKTRYAVKVVSERLIRGVVAELSRPSMRGKGAGNKNSDTAWGPITAAN